MTKFFENLSNNGISSVLSWLLMLIVIGVLYECLIHRNSNSSTKGIDKEIYRGVFIIGVVLFVISIAVNIVYKSPFMWGLLSLLIMVGGMLGFLFSGKSYKSSAKDDDKIKNYMGIGGLSGAIITFIVCFTVIYLKDSSNALIGLVMGTVIGLTGGTLIGIGVGAFIGRIKS